MSTRHPFFVTGLPRSRTAWLSNWLTTDQTLCWHDRKYEEHLTVSARRVGFSGPELAKQFEEVREAWPDSPWLVVLRNHDEARAAAWKVNGVILKTEAGKHGLSDADLNRLLDGEWAAREHRLAVICSKPNVETVAFDDLDKENVARLIWAHLLPGIGFDLERWKLLCELKIEQKFDEVLIERQNKWPSSAQLQPHLK